MSVFGVYVLDMYTLKLRSIRYGGDNVPKQQGVKVSAKPCVKMRRRAYGRSARAFSNTHLETVFESRFDHQIVFVFYFFYRIFKAYLR